MSTPQSNPAQTQNQNQAQGRARAHATESAPRTLPDSEAHFSEMKTDAVSIVEDLTQRFEALQRWHRNAQAGLIRRAQALNGREEKLDEVDAEQKAKATKITRRREAQKRYRTKLERQARELEQTRQSMRADQQRLDERTRALSDQQAEVARLREELDHEWKNLTRIRRSQEALASALEHDRQRINQQRFRLGPNAQVDLESDCHQPPTNKQAA